jgi:hypothetical protein
MAKSKRISVLLTPETERIIEALEQRQEIPVPRSALCQVALESGLEQMLPRRVVAHVKRDIF